MVDSTRIRPVIGSTEDTTRDGPIIYWMSRDQRAEQNWALLYAQEEAKRRNTFVVVCFVIVPEFLDATLRAYDFMIKGLQHTEQQLRDKNIPFHLILGSPEKQIPKVIEKNGASLLITDFDPLRIKKHWKKEIAQQIPIPFHEVDAHNIVPCWIASDKQEFAAHTIRKKLHTHLNRYFIPFEELKRQSSSVTLPSPTDWKKVYASLAVDESVPSVDWLTPGRKASLEQMNRFFEESLDSYNTDRNDPTKDSLSHLSPYLHFGQICSQEILLALSSVKGSQDSKDAFFEQLFVRKELADNFCHYQPQYDSFEGIPKWAKETHSVHASDPREYIYSYSELENAQTHDELWNASQLQMIRTGKMHGYMRMYWAKKILEWTSSPQQAIEWAIQLNDRYELDGRDPNGYVGVLWSIGGVHDRPWFERPVFGKIRYMNYNGAKRKFAISTYINRYTAE